MRIEDAMSNLRKSVQWNGIPAEIFEEVVNLPLSNALTGRPFLEGFDMDFISDITFQSCLLSTVYTAPSFVSRTIQGTPGYLIAEDGDLNNAIRYESPHHKHLLQLPLQLHS